MLVIIGQSSKTSGRSVSKKGTTTENILHEGICWGKCLAGCMKSASNMGDKAINYTQSQLFTKVYE